MEIQNPIIKQLKEVVKPRDANFRQKLYVFLVCLLISVSIWLLIMLSKESVTTLEYPVKFVNMPADMVLKNKPDSTLQFRISSGGFELMTLRYLNRRRPVTVDLSNLTVEKKGDQYLGRYETTQLRSLIFKRFNFSEELISISPEFIYFRFDPLASKKVPVVQDLNIEFEKSYRLSDSIKFTPDSVKIAGPKDLLADCKEVYAVNENPLTGVKADMVINCRLQTPEKIEKIQVIPAMAQADIVVEKYTEATIQVPVSQQIGNVRIKTFPASVQITYLVGLENYERINPGMFTVIPDTTETNRTDATAKIRVAESPSFINISRIEPEVIEYLVIKQ